MTLTGEPAESTQQAIPPGGTGTTGQGAVLLAGSCLPILGAVLLAPVLPRITQAFATTPGVAVLVPIVLTAPALMIGLLAPFAGRIVDAVGRRRILLVALVVYAVVGTAPLWLHALGADALGLVVTSRVLVGITEAAIMTACTTLIGDLWSGPRRDRWFARQTIATTLAATVFFGLGGALGDVSWRAPFWLYLASLAVAVLVARSVPAGERTPAATRPALPPIPWRLILVPCLVSLFGGIVFYTPVVELSLVLAGLGVASTATIGLVSAIASLATAAGAFAFGRAAARSPRIAVLLPLALGLAGAGLLIVGLAHGVVLVGVGAVVASAGTGLLLPTLLSWALSGLDFAERGRGTGLWTAAFFIGQFVCPLVLLAVSVPLGGLSGAVALLGAVTLVVGAGAVAVGARRAAAAR